MDTKQFIDKAKTIHGDRFDYSKVNYIKYNKNIIIICSIHGEFLQTPEKHLIYKGCKQCSISESKKQRISTTENFIKKAFY